jgi:hypothetical protein
MEVITSHTIKMDMNSSLEKLLKEVGIVQNSETRIKDYQDKIAAYKAENEKLIKKAEDLKRFGFVNTPTPKNKAIIDDRIAEVDKKIETLKFEIREKKWLEQTVAKYAIEYPTFKFIPTDTMIEIMKKYDLTLGETCMYSKEIPSIALDILNGFKSKIKQEKYFIDSRIVRGQLTYFSVRSSESVLGTEKQTNYIKSNLKIIAPESHFTNWIIESNGIQIPTFVVNEDTREYEINMAKLNAEVKKNTEVLDPILCLEVDEGYIVLHAWDEEAYIPEIKNTILN